MGDSFQNFQIAPSDAFFDVFQLIFMTETSLAFSFAQCASLLLVLLRILPLCFEFVHHLRVFYAIFAQVIAETSTHGGLTVEGTVASGPINVCSGR